MDTIKQVGKMRVWRPPSIAPGCGALHPAPGAVNTPVFLMSDIASVSPVNIALIVSLCKMKDVTWQGREQPANPPCCH